MYAIAYIGRPMKVVNLLISGLKCLVKLLTDEYFSKLMKSLCCGSTTVVYPVDDRTNSYVKL